MKNILREKEGHYLMFKRSIQEEDTTIVNTHAPNTGSEPHLQPTPQLTATLDR